MKIRLADHLMKKLSQLGTAIDIDRQFQVFDEGVVGIINAEPEKENGSERQGTRGPPAGSREGSSGPWWSPGEAGTRLRQLQQQQVVQLAGLSELFKAYSGQIIEGDHGLWIIVKSYPLGTDGPQATFVIAYPFSFAIQPRGWAFWKLGSFPKWIGPRHTNFPDASICAFGPGDWERKDGLVSLVDFYSTWLIRQLYFQEFGRWPGRQHGLTALYRRTEFSSDEWCGCGRAKRYGECCFEADALVSEEDARTEHKRIMGADYTERRPPPSLIKFVRSDFKTVPAFKDIFEGR